MNSNLSHLRIKFFSFLLISLIVILSIKAIGQSKAPSKEKDTDMEITPNPAKKNSKFILRLKKADVVTLDLYDSKNVFVERIFDNKPLEKGKHEVLINRKKNNTETYTCILSTKNSGKYTDYLIFEEDEVTEISYSEVTKGLLIGPNPARDFIEVSSPGRPLNRIIIQDMIGNTAMNEQVENSENYKVDLTKLHPGMYFLTLRRREETSVVRIIKTE